VGQKLNNPIFHTKRCAVERCPRSCPRGLHVGCLCRKKKIRPFVLVFCHGCHSLPGCLCQGASVSGVSTSDYLPRILCLGITAQESLLEQNYLAINVTCAPFNTLNSSLAFPLFTAISNIPALPMYATGSPSGTDPNVRDTDGSMVFPT